MPQFCCSSYVSHRQNICIRSRLCWLFDCCFYDNRGILFSCGSAAALMGMVCFKWLHDEQHICPQIQWLWQLEDIDHLDCFTRVEFWISCLTPIGIDICDFSGNGSSFYFSIHKLWMYLGLQYLACSLKLSEGILRYVWQIWYNQFVFIVYPPLVWLYSIITLRFFQCYWELSGNYMNWFVFLWDVAARR